MRIKFTSTERAVYAAYKQARSRYIAFDRKVAKGQAQDNGSIRRELYIAVSQAFGEVVKHPQCLRMYIAYLPEIMTRALVANLQKKEQRFKSKKAQLSSHELIQHDLEVASLKAKIERVFNQGYVLDDYLIAQHKVGKQVSEYRVKNAPKSGVGWHARPLAFKPQPSEPPAMEFPPAPTAVGPSPIEEKKVRTQKAKARMREHSEAVKAWRKRPIDKKTGRPVYSPLPRWVDPWDNNGKK